MSTTQCVSSMVERLPIVLVQLIFQALDLPTFLQFGRSSHHFYRIADSDPSWKQVDLRHNSKSLKMPMVKFRRRMVVLDSSHTSAFLSSSLIHRHANISWDVCHDTVVWQKYNFEALHGSMKWPDKWKLEELDSNFTTEFIYEIESEIHVLSECIPYLHTLVIGDGLTSKAMERIFQAQTKRNSLETVVLTTNSKCTKHVSQILEDSAFIFLVSIASLTKLSLSSAYYKRGQLALLSNLFALESLRLENLQDSLQVFDQADLLTIGQCSSLKDLFIEEGRDTFTPQFTIQFLQQTNLRNQLISLTLCRFDSNNGYWSEELLIRAFNGYNSLECLQFQFTRSRNLLHVLLSVLSTSSFMRSDVRINTDTLSSVGQDLSLNPSCTIPGVFLPSLTKLAFYGIILRLLPPLADWELLLKCHSRGNLCIQFHLDSEGTRHEEIYSIFLHLSREYPSQFGFLQNVPDPPNSNLRRTCCRAIGPWCQMIKSLIKLFWIENEQADHVRPAIHDLNYRRLLKPN